MKKAICILLFLALPFLGHAQYQAEPTMLQKDLAMKSERQFKTGKIFMLGGTGLILLNSVIPYRYNYNTGRSNDGLRSTFGTLGSIMLFTSIPFFLESGSNGRMAAKLYLDNQALHSPVYREQFPALRLQIPIRAR